MLEEYIGVFGHSASHGSVGVEASLAELGESFTVEQRSELVGVEAFDFLYLMGSPESVEEIDERHAAFYGCEVGYGGKVHHILMVAEDAERMRCESTCGHVENPRKKFSGNLIHIGKHQEQSLRCGVCRGERARLKRAVDGSGGSGLALHFLKKDCLPENVLPAVGRPVVHVFGHRG